ncbi:MAG: TadE family protein [Chloroflexota bacterium]|nr:TadE family protein [Chloroflexota bacterium]
MQSRQTAQKGKGQDGQTLAEFAIVMPILVLLFFGMTLAAFYAFRSSSVNWGVFIEGVSTGTYNTTAEGHARSSVLWPELSGQIALGRNEQDREVRSRITFEHSRPWIFGIQLTEAQRAGSFYRLWRFYPGPPSPGGVE